jgi:hypothetical protein
LPDAQKKFAAKQEPVNSKTYLRARNKTDNAKFFDDEETNECGKSAENAIFGGHVIDAWRPQFDGIDFHKLDGWHVMALYTENWVNHKGWKRKVEKLDPKQRYRFSENFQEGAICEYVGSFRFLLPFGWSCSLHFM